MFVRLQKKTQGGADCNEDPQSGKSRTKSLPLLGGEGRGEGECSSQRNFPTNCAGLFNLASGEWKPLKLAGKDAWSYAASVYRPGRLAGGSQFLCQ